MTRSKLSYFIEVFIASFVLIAALFILPFAADAMTNDEFNSLSGGKLYYVDASNNHYIMTNADVKKADVVDTSDDLSVTVDYVRSKMINREEKIEFYLAISSKAYTSSQTDNIGAVFNRISSGVYSTNGITDSEVKACSGDYLKMMTTSLSSVESGRLEASNQSTEFDYYHITLSAAYASTKEMEDETKIFLEKWQRIFIDENAFINSEALTVNERNYYILKTIYSFLSYNTEYDSKVYDSTVKEDSLQYRNSHSAYGALFGLTQNSESVVTSSEYNWKTETDAQGLTKIVKHNQGLSVCDGYTLVTYYLCTINGIECNIVTGEYPNKETQKEKDPHAWNVVYLCPSDSNVYSAANAKGYYYDATFSSTSSATIKLTDQIVYDASSAAVSLDSLTVLDYSYFLRGSANLAFDSNVHQQPYEAVGNMDTADYKMLVASIDFDKAWKVLTRRVKKDNYHELENYFLISPYGRYYKISSDGNYKLIEDSNDIVYDGNEYYYNLNVQDFVNGVEYQCEDLLLKDSQSASLLIKDINGSNTLYSFGVKIKPLDMSGWDSYSRLMWNGTDIKNSSKADEETNILFGGAELSFNVDIYDVSEYKLVPGTDYIITYEDENGNKVSSPWDIGKYKISIDFISQNYSNSLKIPFNIVKTDFQSFSYSGGINNVTYASDISACVPVLSNDKITLYENVDYIVSLEDASKINYGDTGYIICTATPNNKYFIAGTVFKKIQYAVTRQYDLSGAISPSASVGVYEYTGSEIKPSGFTLTVNNGYVMTQGRDFIIASYSDNINVGTGYVTIQFMGNYCGFATMSFQITEPQQNSSSGGDNIIINNSPQSNNAQSGGSVYYYVEINGILYFNGKEQTPETKVTYNGSVISASDYTVSTAGSAPGVYTVEIKGKGIYSAVNELHDVVVLPVNVSGITNTATDKSVILGWNNQGGETYYKLYVYDSKKKQWVYIAKTGKASYTVKNVVLNGKKVSVAANKSYKFKIQAYIDVTANGERKTYYSGSTQFSAKSAVKTPKLKKVKKGKKKLTASWTKANGAKGYILEAAADKKFKKGKKSVTVKKGNTLSAAVNKLKSKKTYYVRVCAYVTASGKKIKTPYSNVIKIKL